MNRYSILVADEDPATRAFLSDNLRADGYRVASAASAREALHALASARPHVVIAGLNGRTLGLVDAVRRGDRPACLDPDTPLLVLTDRSDALSRVRVFERGGDDVMAKPFGCGYFRTSGKCLVVRGFGGRRGVFRCANPGDIAMSPGSGGLLAG